MDEEEEGEKKERGEGREEGGRREKGGRREGGEEEKVLMSNRPIRRGTISEMKFHFSLNSMKHS